MTEKPGKSLSVYDCITELLIGLLGETSLFFTLNAEGTRIVVFKPNLDLLPALVALNADLFTGLATNVRNLKLWRADFVAADEVKRALIESAYGFFNDYISAIDDHEGLRMDHISGRRKLDYGELMAFVGEWHHRIYYIALLVRNTRELCGIDAMNAVYREWCLLCAEDSNYEVLETSLRQMSAAFHEQVRGWMLNGRLPTGCGVHWMLRDITTAAQPPASHQSSDVHSYVKQLLLNPSVTYSPMAAVGTTVNVNVDGKSVTSGGVSRLEIDWARVPLAYGGSPDFVRQIFLIGRNIQLLNEFRAQKTYDHRLDERTELLHDDGRIDKFKVWYSPAERARFRSVVQSYADIVNADVMFEITERQRLLDHIAFIQSHFLLLHGDFSVRLYEKISETAVGRSGATTHYLTTYKLDAMVMECVRYALSLSHSADSVPVEIRDNLCAGDVAHMSSTITGTGSDGTDGKGIIGSPLGGSSGELKNGASSSKKRLLQRALIRSMDGLFLEDLVRISYNTTGLISEVLTPPVLRSYSCVFGAFVAWRLLHFRVDETATTFAASVRRRRPPLLFGDRRSEELRAIRFTRMVLANVQRYIVSILGYVFDEVFSVECPRSLVNLRRQVDLPALIAVHNDFFSTISLALFVNRTSQPVFEALRHCLKTARQVLRRVDALREWSDRLPPADVVFNDDGDYEGGDDVERQHEADESKERLWDIRRSTVEEAYDTFLVTTLKLRTAVAALCLTDAKQSPHWRHFEPNPLFVPPKLLAAGQSGSVEVVVG